MVDPSTPSGSSRNYFVLQTLADFYSGSPVLTVTDALQPVQGFLSPTKAPEPADRDGFTVKSEVVLRLKALQNEDLLPSSASEVSLAGIGQSSLLRNRRDRRSVTQK